MRGLKDIFENCKTIPIHFSDFESYGIERTEYVRYMRRVELLRSVYCCFYYYCNTNFEFEVFYKSYLELISLNVELWKHIHDRMLLCFNTYGRTRYGTTSAFCYVLHSIVRDILINHYTRDYSFPDFDSLDNLDYGSCEYWNSMDEKQRAYNLKVMRPANSVVSQLPKDIIPLYYRNIEALRMAYIYADRLLRKYQNRIEFFKNCAHSFARWVIKQINCKSIRSFSLGEVLVYLPVTASQPEFGYNRMFPIEMHQKCNSGEKDVYIDTYHECCCNTYISPLEWASAIDSIIFSALFGRLNPDNCTIEDENHEKRTFCKEYSALVSDLKTTIRSKPLFRIDFNNWDKYSFQIIEYADYYNRILESFDSIENCRADYENYIDPETLYVTKGIMRCVICNHPIESTTAFFIERNGREIELNANHCTMCNINYISYESYCSYLDMYGILLGRIEIMIDGNSSFGKSNTMNDSSPLRVFGYTVNSIADFSDDERHSFLYNVIETGIMRKFEVIRYLEMFIRFQGKKKGNEAALKKWKEDLRYVNNLNINTQRRVLLGEIKPYKTIRDRNKHAE